MRGFPGVKSHLKLTCLSEDEPCISPVNISVAPMQMWRSSRMVHSNLDKDFHILNVVLMEAQRVTLATAVAIIMMKGGIILFI
jgi:hypothetical protein